MNPPEKPFPEYKWRWAVVTPTEGLNDPPVYFGVLRTLRRFEGVPPSNELLQSALQDVEAETNSTVQLARDPERNLIRNSGQYWKATGLLSNSRGQILLTEFGQRVADGKIVPSEFAMTVVKSLELPNRRIDSKANLWGDLRIRPLELILKILTALGKQYGQQDSYLTPEELTSIVIPLAGEKAEIQKYIDALHLYRLGKLDLNEWPDCTPGANDRRMAKEFLLFLNFYGLVREESVTSASPRFYLANLEYDEVGILADIPTDDLVPEETLERLRGTLLPEVVERRVVLTRALERPLQSKFREGVLTAFQGRCLVTGTRLSAVLEVAHIVPISRHGTDSLDNGLCLRADIHRLFDTGHMRLESNGSIHLSEIAAHQDNYSNLPSKVNIPDFTSLENLSWRWSYG